MSFTVALDVEWVGEVDPTVELELSVLPWFGLPLDTCGDDDLLSNNDVPSLSTSLFLNPDTYTFRFNQPCYVKQSETCSPWPELARNAS